jgi:hypothetical protein
VTIVVTALGSSARSGQGWVGGATAVSDSVDFAEFVRVSLPGLLRYGHALTGNPHDAGDLVQMVLEKSQSSKAMATLRARLAEPPDKTRHSIPPAAVAELENSA